MRAIRYLCLAGVLAALATVGGNARAGVVVRQYYGAWTYYPTGGYYYRYYYYKPYAEYDGYQYHYCTYYYSRPRYVYYYNPVRRYYWGRLDMEAKDDNKYSLLKEEDRKADLKDIKEEAFPKPGKMPNIPESKDNVAIEPIKDGLPKEEKKE